MRSRGLPRLSSSLKQVALLGSIAFLLFVFFRDWAYDDPFVTLRYAANLQAGRGFVYNVGQRVLSTTTPLYTLLIAAWGLLWSNLPRLSTFISAASLWWGSVALYVLGRRWRTPLAGIVAALLYLSSPYLVSTFGAETNFYLMLVLWAMALYAHENFDGAAILAGLATLTRGDGVLIAGLLTGLLVVRKRAIPWRFGFLFGMVTVPWFLFSWFYFGSPFPVTLAVKQAQARMAISDSFLEGLFRLLRGYARQPLYWPHITLLGIGVGYGSVRRREWLLLAAWAVLYVTGYTLLGVSRYFWYYAPLMPVFFAFVGLGGEFLCSRWKWKKQPLHRFGTWALITLLLWPHLTGLWRLYYHPDPRARLYRDVGLWLAQHTLPDARVGTLEVGIIGYYAQRPMVDFAGLIQPEVARLMRSETTYEDTALWAVQTYRPEFLVLNPNWFPRLMQGVVARFCAPVEHFSRPEYPGELVVYRCRWGSAGP